MTTAFAAGRDAWRQSPTGGEALTLPIADRYDLRWALAQGQPLDHHLRGLVRRVHPKIYANTRLLYNHVPAVVQFYASVVYQGDLPTDGKPLPDGTEGAIPIDPQTGDDAQNAALRTGIAELWNAWNWKDHMTTRPKMTAALGDVLTELIDDVPRGVVYPQVIWPGYVTDLELDYVGNVKAYRLQYRVTEDDGRGNVQTYMFAKEVDKDEFRYFKDDRPWNAPDRHGDAVQPNPYGFVPAIWDRHEKGTGVRGIAACDATIGSLLTLNSLYSHATDFQEKAYSLPWILAGGQGMGDGSGLIKTRERPQTEEDIRKIVESQDYVPAQSGANLIEPKADIGQAPKIVQDIKDGILDLNPEASFWSELRQMSQVTAPGAQRVLGDAVQRADRVRAGADAQTVKLVQMALAMAGFRYRQGQGGWAKRTRRQQAWAPYDLTSYAQGALDFSIKSRPVIPETPAERIALLQAQESLTTQYALEKAGVDPEDAKAIIKQKQDAATLGQF